MSTNKSNKSTLIIIIIVVVAAAALVLLGLFYNPRNWQETYEADSEQPYGTKVLHDLLKASHKAQSFVYVKDSVSTQLNIEHSGKTDTYFYVGHSHYTDSADVNALLEFVRSGNNAFIVSYAGNEIADSLLKPLIRNHYAPDEDYENDLSDEESNAIEIVDEQWPIAVSHYGSINDTISKLKVKGLSGTQRTMTLKKLFDGETQLTKWHYFSPDITTLDGDSIEVLGQLNNKHANFIRFKYGKGYIYMHCTPLAFSNYYMIEEEGMKYCREVLSYVGDGTIYWDEDSRDMDFQSFSYNPTHTPHKGPLEFILSEPALQRAWYLLLLATLLFVLFGAKRTQRIIPPMAKMDNTSIEYAEVISQMFMKQKDHKKLISMKMDLFKAFLRERFRVKLSHQEDSYDDLFIANIAQKSSVDQRLVEDIFKQYSYLNALATVDTADMMKFHLQLERFYHNCK
jgi:hypothetical protein